MTDTTMQSAASRSPGPWRSWTLFVVLTVGNLARRVTSTRGPYAFELGSNV